MSIWLPVCISIICLVLLISIFKMQAFIAFIIVAILLGLCLSMNIDQCIIAIQKGIGDTSGSIIPILVPGAMIGKLVAKSGVAEVISSWLVNKLGSRRLPLVFMIIGFIVGLPLFFSVAFLLLVPIVLAVAERYKMNAVHLGMPLLASLSVTQGYLPPHPAPYYLVTHLQGADMGITLALGIVIAIPAILVSGLWFGNKVKNTASTPLQFISQQEPGNAPSVQIGLLVLLLPVVLISAQSVLKNLVNPNALPARIIAFTGQPIIALVITLFTAIYFLSVRRKIANTVLQDWLLQAVKDIAPLILTFAGAGAFKEILQEVKVGEAILQLFANGTINPLIYAWIIAALLRIVTGSSTVSGITTAGLIAPVLLHSTVNANLMVLSIGAGSMVFSHVNDSGFWLFREYFGVSLKDTLKTWTMMETLIAVTGLAGVLVLHYCFYT